MNHMDETRGSVDIQAFCNHYLLAMLVDIHSYIFCILIPISLGAGLEVISEGKIKGLT